MSLTSTPSVQPISSHTSLRQRLGRDHQRVERQVAQALRPAAATVYDSVARRTMPGADGAVGVPSRCGPSSVTGVRSWIVTPRRSHAVGQAADEPGRVDAGAVRGVGRLQAALDPTTAVDSSASSSATSSSPRPMASRSCWRARPAGAALRLAWSRRRAPPLRKPQSMPSRSTTRPTRRRSRRSRASARSDRVAPCARGRSVGARRSAARHPAAVPARRAEPGDLALADDDAQVGLRRVEVVRGPQAGEPGADDRDVAVDVAGQRRPRRPAAPRCRRATGCARGNAPRVLPSPPRSSQRSSVPPFRLRRTGFHPGPGTLPRRSCVYGCLGASRMSVVVPCSTATPRCMTIVVGDLAHDGQVVADQDVADPGRGADVGEQVQDLGLDRDVERRDRLVEHRTRGSAASARAIATRWRWPPERARGGRGAGGRRGRPGRPARRPGRGARPPCGRSAAAAPRRCTRPVVWRGSSELYGSWNTIWVSRPRRRRSSTPAAPGSCDRSRPPPRSVPTSASPGRRASGERRLAGARLPDDGRATRPRRR